MKKAGKHPQSYAGCRGIYYWMLRAAKIALWLFIGLSILELALRMGGMIYLGFEGLSGSRSGEDEPYRILCLGDSSTVGWENAWPGQLQMLLDQSNPGRYKIYNAAVAGTGIEYLLSKLESNIDKYRPDMIITMIGFGNSESPFVFLGNEEGRQKSLEGLRTYKLAGLLANAFLNRAWPDGTAKKNGQISADDTCRKAYFWFNETPDGMSGHKRRFIDIEKEANRYEAEGRAEDAERVFTGAAEDTRDNIYLYEYMTEHYARLNEPDKTIGAALNAIELIDETDVSDDATGRHLQYLASIIYEKLGYAYALNREYDAAENAALKAYALELGLGGKDSLAPGWIYDWHLRILIEQKRYEQAETRLKEAIDACPNNEVLERDLLALYMQMCQDYRASGMSEGEINRFLVDKGVRFGVSYNFSHLNTENITQRRLFASLYEQVHDRGIIFVAVQYPTLDISQLKAKFDGDEDIIFISNRENFEKALRESRYEELFTDRYGTSFGHTTRKGSRVVAESIARTIQEETSGEIKAMK